MFNSMYFHLALPRAGHKLAYKVTIRRTTIERIADGGYWTKIAHELSWAIGVNITLDDSEGIKKILNPYLKGKFKLGGMHFTFGEHGDLDKLKIMKYLSILASKGKLEHMQVWLPDRRMFKRMPTITNPDIALGIPQGQPQPIKRF